MKEVRLPAYPLVTHDPMFSLWSPGETPNCEDPIHWCGTRKRFNGTLFIDGESFRFLGRVSPKPMRLVRREVTPLSTEFVLEARNVQLTLRFTSPLLPDDLDILSTPITYIQYSVRALDGKPHTYCVQFNLPADICHSGEVAPQMRQDFFSDGNLNYAYMGQLYQKVLGGSGDRMSCDWGYVFLATEDTLGNAPTMADVQLRYEKTASGDFSSMLLIGYDEVASINYFGRFLPSYFARDGKTITQALREFYENREDILSRCHAFDAKLLEDARKKGGDDYALIVSAAYRQSIAAHKLVADTNGDILFISKENDSNGCAATVDVSYPSVPLYLLYAPELVRGMLRPVLKFSKMPVWKYDFAPHDVGRYPILNGQIYAAHLRTKNQATGAVHAPYYLYPDTVDAYNFAKQMPVEESANMLLMLAACGRADGDYRLAEENLELLRTWCAYLLKYGEDPGEQLCTDDFAGHLARNVNLSAKAMVGVGAFARILQALGYADEAKTYEAHARAMAESWLERADVGGYTSLTFNGDGWSMKYNLVWDKLLGLKLLPDSFYAMEIGSYLKRMNPYGLPLDSRAEYTKSDWLMWTAAMADSRDFPAFAEPLARFLRESGSHVPFSDYYDTRTALYERFMGRSVQGGVFMPLLMDAWK